VKAHRGSAATVAPGKASAQTAVMLRWWARAGIDAADFLELYSEDFFYEAIGLASESMFIAHRAAGGITSIYRQLGMSSERLIQAAFQMTLGLTADDLKWSYRYPKPNGDHGVHTLDATIMLDRLPRTAADRLRLWTRDVQSVTGNENPAKVIGTVFEIRQGYKSADAKRQNADLRFGMRAYQASLLPIILVLSNQISIPVARRYRADGLIVLTGDTRTDSFHSTYAFMNEVIGFDLADFFERNSQIIRDEVSAVIENLLSTD